MLFTFHSFNYPLGFTRVGVDMRNFHYLAEEDEASCSYQVGPGVKIPFNKNVSLKLNTFYAFEPNGVSPEDTIVYKATFNISF
jgi:hypothetical protein